jgi:hypothetical protein
MDCKPLQQCIPSIPLIQSSPIDSLSKRSLICGQMWVTATLPGIALLAMRAAMLTVSPQCRVGGAPSRHGRQRAPPSQAEHRWMSWPFGGRKVQRIPADRPFAQASPPLAETTSSVGGSTVGPFPYRIVENQSHNSHVDPQSLRNFGDSSKISWKSKLASHLSILVMPLTPLIHRAFPSEHTLLCVMVRFLR